MSPDPRFWDAIAERYARKPVGNPEANEKKIAITRSLISGGDVILDVGCGTGSLALRLAPDAGHVHGLDLSREMVRIARDKAAAQAVGNVTFHVGPFDDSFTVFDPGSLNGICANSVLHLIEDLPGVLRRIHGLLKPGGFFASSTLCLGRARLLYGPLLWAMRLVGKAPRVELFDRQALLDEIAAAGFVDVERPDVGARPNSVFVVARKHATRAADPLAR